MLKRSPSFDAEMFHLKIASGAEPLGVSAGMSQTNSQWEAAAAGDTTTGIPAVCETQAETERATEHVGTVEWYFKRPMTLHRHWIQIQLQSTSTDDMTAKDKLVGGRHGTKCSISSRPYNSHCQ